MFGCLHSGLALGIGIHLGRISRIPAFGCSWHSTVAFGLDIERPVPKAISSRPNSEPTCSTSLSIRDNAQLLETGGLARVCPRNGGGAGSPSSPPLVQRPAHPPAPPYFSFLFLPPGGAVRSHISLPCILGGGSCSRNGGSCRCSPATRFASRTSTPSTRGLALHLYRRLPRHRRRAAA
jgi:hypothetical protein